ncbi:MAG: DUF2946 family protein [Acidobacteriota bacterium]
MSVLTAWLILGAIVLGGGLIETHSHDELSGERPTPVALSGEHEVADSTPRVDPSGTERVDFCPFCTLGQREGGLDAAEAAPRSRIVIEKSLRATQGPAVYRSVARPPAPRGPPTA